MQPWVSHKADLQVRPILLCLSLQRVHCNHCPALVRDEFLPIVGGTNVERLDKSIVKDETVEVVSYSSVAHLIKLAGFNLEHVTVVCGCCIHKDA